MMRFVNTSLEDADIILFVTDLFEKHDEVLVQRLKSLEQPVIMVVNKIDLSRGSQVYDKIAYWHEIFTPTKTIKVSALKGENINLVFNSILEFLPKHEAYFPKDEITDKPEKFFVEEIIREKIFHNYKKEVPYSTQVIVEEFKEDEKIIRIRALIYVERKSQKGIIIGHKGEKIKKVGIEARQDIETFFTKKIYLETYVKVANDWRNKKLSIKEFGY
jgi:GTP-binding protein Era